ncbi:hypothetical protein Tco_0840358 [Tanacetum coccineum]|uniref:Uncharacterized protein n=1 Tax=Tanacetum coccineum TaxID=301880 RepID=A0ABQ5AXQ7_9ASTR
METKDTLSSCLDLDEQEIQQLQKQANILKENSLNKLNALKTTIQHLSSSNSLMYYTFKDAFHRLFEADKRTFRMVEKVNERKLQIQECKVQKVKASNASSGDNDCSRIVSDKENDQVEKADSNVTPDSPDMCDNEIQTDHNAIECDDERVTLANLIANLKIDIDEKQNDSKAIKESKRIIDSRIERVQIYSCRD